VSKESGPVLLAYDRSESSATAIAVAGRLLRGRRALVCHVWTGLSHAMLRAEPAELPGALRDAAEELDRADLEAAQNAAAEGVRLARAAGFDAEALPVRESRKTWRTLVEAAEGSQASLIVAGAHGMSGVGRALLGSVSTALVHHSPVPVLVVPAAAREERTEGPLLLCYDGSEPAKRAITQAGTVLAPRPALVLHVWESWAAEAPALAGLSRSVQGMATDLDEIADAQSRDATADGVASAELAGFDAVGLSERATGPTWSAVLDYADQHSCAAIVLGSRGLSGISAALGSVSNGVVHHSRRPVLVVPPEEAER
jgi:nucleotide-binding universal stress UspA family protein